MMLLREMVREMHRSRREDVYQPPVDPIRLIERWDRGRPTWPRPYYLDKLPDEDDSETCYGTQSDLACTRAVNKLQLEDIQPAFRFDPFLHGVNTALSQEMPQSYSCIDKAGLCGMTDLFVAAMAEVY